MLKRNMLERKKVQMPTVPL